MADVQEIFNRIQASKREQKKLVSMYRDALLNSEQLKSISEELKALREKKKKIEESIKDDFRSELSTVDNLKADIENDSLLMSDAAFTKIVKGERLEIKDEYDHTYEPEVRVRFKKSR